MPFTRSASAFSSPWFSSVMRMDKQFHESEAGGFHSSYASLVSFVSHFHWHIVGVENPAMGGYGGKGERLWAFIFTYVCHIRKGKRLNGYR
jgi:hypothetical protein